MRVSVLLIVGEQDRLTPAREREIRVRRALESSSDAVLTVRRIDGADHALMLEPSPQASWMAQKPADRSWSIIPQTLAIAPRIDSLRLFTPGTGGAGDSAAVWTSQRWERLMLCRDGETRDTVLTMQQHRETWRRTARGWRQYHVEELGGQVWLNGKLYRP